MVDYVPAGHWCTTTLIGALRLDGARVPMVIEGSTDTDVFMVKAFLKKMKARTVDALIKAISMALEQITSDDTRRWFKESGYVNTQT